MDLKCNLLKYKILLIKYIKQNYIFKIKNNC